MREYVHLIRIDRPNLLTNQHFQSQISSLSQETRKKLIQAAHARARGTYRERALHKVQTHRETHGQTSSRKQARSILPLACHAGGKARRTTMPASFHIKSRANRESHGELPRGTHRSSFLSSSPRRALARCVSRRLGSRSRTQEGHAEWDYRYMWDRAREACESSCPGSSVSPMPPARSRLSLSLWSNVISCYLRCDKLAQLRANTPRICFLFRAIETQSE